MGDNTEQLEGHLAPAKADGPTASELEELRVHMAFRAGRPEAVSASTVAERVFAE